jgi:putative resolvase
MDKYMTTREIQQHFSLSNTTLQRYELEKKVKCVRTPGGFRRYLFSDIQRLFDSPNIGRKKCIYARVSSSQQKDDLQRQIEDLLKHSPDSTVYKDVGSGLNWKRPQFKALLDAVYRGEISEVVVSHRDRLCRFGSDLVEWIFEKHGTRLVLCELEDSKNHTHELADDLLAITNFFVARHNGLRSAAHKRKRLAAQSEMESIGGNNTTNASDNPSKKTKTGADSGKIETQTRGKAN